MITTVKNMRNLLTSFNASLKKMAYKGVWKMKKGELSTIIQNDFKTIPKTKGQHQYKHKSGRFTKKY
jgi:hypothetical protein